MSRPESCPPYFYHGVAFLLRILRLVVRASLKAGAVKVTVSAEGCETTTIIIPAEEPVVPLTGRENPVPVYLFSPLIGGIR